MFEIEEDASQQLKWKYKVIVLNSHGSEVIMTSLQDLEIEHGSKLDGCTDSLLTARVLNISACHLVFTLKVEILHLPQKGGCVSQGNVTYSVYDQTEHLSIK